MSVPEPEILSMEEVRRLTTIANNMVPFMERGPRGEAVTERTLGRLCLTVEHWHREAEKAENARRHGQRANLHEHCRQVADTEEERDRLRALVAGMREALCFLDPLCPDCAEPPGQCLADPDGQRAADLAAKDREAAEKWCTLMEATDEQQDPEHAAFIERATRAIAEGEEELRLLRELEASSAADATPGYRSSRTTDAMLALAAFRARQKGAGAA